jgi:uncharacterized protein (DUF1501 family)
MKKSVQKEHELSRRRFLSGSACASLGTTGIVNTLAQLRMMNAAVAAGPALGDYKAMVVLFLYGGNDSFNTLIPSSNHPEWNNYSTNRGILAHNDDPGNEGPNANPNLAGNILRINYPDAANPQYGVHPELSGMRDMFNDGELAFISNVGTLSEPIADRTEYLSGSKILPVQLFSHSNQQEQWQSSIPDKPFTSGWGGRMSDLLNASYGNGDISMNVTLAGVNNFQVGTSPAAVQYGVGVNGATSLSGYGTGYANALVDPSAPLFGPGYDYTTNSTGLRLKALESTMQATLDLTGENLHEVGFENVLKSARQNEAFVGNAITEADGQFDFETHFTNYGATSGTANQLKMIAKLIAGRNCLGNSRQVFFCSMGGYDTHRNMLPDHNTRMRELDPAVKAFNDALKSVGAYDNVLLVSPSDFARTLTPNGNDPNSSGSDHAWGSNTFISGGPVKGGKVYGNFPSLLVGDGAPLDAGSARGRWIPTTSTDQFSSICAKWFGVQEGTDMATVFPNLSRFNDPFTDPGLDMIDYTV